MTKIERTCTECGMIDIITLGDGDFKSPAHLHTNGMGYQYSYRKLEE